MTDKPDFDFDSIDGMDDADADSLYLLIKERRTGKYGWHWIYRDTLADHARYELAGYGLVEDWGARPSISSAFFPHARFHRTSASALHPCDCRTE
jgi:hypothetical protein